MVKVNKKAVDTVLTVLPAALRPRAQDGGTPTVELDVRGKRVVLRPVWAGQGFPRDLHAALKQMPDHISDETILVARRFSRCALQELSKLGYNWADETGGAWISLPSLVVATRGRDDSPLPRSREEWSPAAALVAETILTGFLRGGSDLASPLSSGGGVAKQAEVSAGRVAQVLQSFDARGYTRKEGSSRGRTARRFPVDPARLLSDWAGWYREQSKIDILMHTIWGTARSFISDELSVITPATGWAVTDWLAVDLRAPIMTDVPTVSIYVDHAIFDTTLESRAEEAGLRRVESGGRVRFLRADAVALKDAETVDGIRVVSPIRLFGDLLRLGGRGEDAAEHLRSTAIGW